MQAVKIQVSINFAVSDKFSNAIKQSVKSVSGNKYEFTTPFFLPTLYRKSFEDLTNAGKYLLLWRTFINLAYLV